MGVENLKTAKLFIFIGAVIAGLLCVRSPARAQPASGTGSDEASSAPSAGDPASTDDDSSSEDDSTLIDDPNSPWSQGVSVEDRRAARALLREGARLYMVPLYEKAAEQYIAALRKWKHPALYYNLALTQRNLGKESDALENLERALKYGEQGLGPKRFREAQKQLADVKRLLGRLRVICKVPGAEVTLDGVTLFIGPGSYEGWVKAKSHEITAKRAGYISEARRVTVASEQRQDVELKLITLDEAADASRRWAVWKPWAVVIAGSAIAAASGGIHALASRNFTSYDDQFGDLNCAIPMGDPPRVPGCPKDDSQLEEKGLNDLLKLARREQALAVGGYIVGGSLIATGVMLLYMNRPRMSEQEAGSRSMRAVTVVPEVSGNMFGVLVRVSH
jgi:hypothetical protein